ncbi:MAG: hypothetical protein ACRD2P_17570 [Terriglobia bacterium]
MPKPCSEKTPLEQKLVFRGRRMGRMGSLLGSARELRLLERARAMWTQVAAVCRFGRSSIPASMPILVLTCWRNCPSRSPGPDDPQMLAAPIETGPTGPAGLALRFGREVTARFHCARRLCSSLKVLREIHLLHVAVHTRATIREFM